MIALPAETVDAGFIPSIFVLSLCWIFTYVSSLVTLEASWLASSTFTDKKRSVDNNENSAEKINEKYYKRSAKNP